jgi:predicted HAD superfamily hydrolase
MVSAIREFEALSLGPQSKVISVDIFDTLLLRSTMPESEKFMLFAKEKADFLGERSSCFERIDDNYLYFLRLYAAQAAYRNKSLNNSAREASLDDIYKIMLNALTQDLQLSSTEAAEIKKAFHVIELSIEMDDLVVNDELIAVLKKASAGGKSIIAISDMYLPQEDIDGLLKAHGVLALFDEVHVSGVYGFGKACGELYNTVLRKHELAASELVHIGDNWHSDYRVPSEMEIKSFYYPRSIGWRIVRKIRTKLNAFKNGSI